LIGLFDYEEDEGLITTTLDEWWMNEKG